MLGPGQDGKTIQSEGLPASQMTADQQAALLKLIGHYTGLVNDEDAAARMAEIKSTLDQTYFAWYGPTTEGSAAYFRVTGPTIVIEYSPQGVGGGRGGGGQGRPPSGVATGWRRGWWRWGRRSRRHDQQRDPRPHPRRLPRPDQRVRLQVRVVRSWP